MTVLVQEQRKFCRCGNNNKNGDFLKKNFVRRLPLAVQWLRLSSSTAGDLGLIPGQGTRIPHAVWQKKKSLFLTEV